MCRFPVPEISPISLEVVLYTQNLEHESTVFPHRGMGRQNATRNGGPQISACSVLSDFSSLRPEQYHQVVDDHVERTAGVSRELVPHHLGSSWWLPWSELKNGQETKHVKMGHVKIDRAHFRRTQQTPQ